MLKRIWSYGLVLLLSTSVQAQNRPLTVIELFTSQGCSSCPPANDNLALLAKRPDVLALSFGVTYWDYLGWRDTFASRANTQRQRDYVRGLGLRNLYTPQMVINGRADTVGVRLGDVDRISAQTARSTNVPNLTSRLGQISLSGGQPNQAAAVWLVRYDPRTIQVPVQRGENTGKTLPHTNVVRELTQLGTYVGRPLNLALPPPSDAILKSAILVQGQNGGPIIAALKL